MGTDQKLDRVLRDGEGMMQSATELVRPPCHLCGEPQNRWYIDLRYTAAGRLVVCIPCANSQRDEGEWKDPDAPANQPAGPSPNQFVFLPSADSVPGELIGPS